MTILAADLTETHENYQLNLPQAVDPDVYDDAELPEAMVLAFQLARKATAAASQILNSKPALTRSAQELGGTFAQRGAWVFPPRSHSSRKSSKRDSEQEGGSGDSYKRGSDPKDEAPRKRAKTRQIVGQ